MSEYKLKFILKESSDSEFRFNFEDIGTNSLFTNIAFSEKEIDSILPAQGDGRKERDQKRETVSNEVLKIVETVKYSGEPVLIIEEMITEAQFNQTNTILIHAAPKASAAFKASGNPYWTGILRIDATEKKSGTIIDLGDIEVGKSAVSFLVDLIQQYSGSNHKPLQDIRDGLAKGDQNILGKLGVMGEPHDRYMGELGRSGLIGLYDMLALDGNMFDQGYYDNELRKVTSTEWKGVNHMYPVHTYDETWGKTEISRYDFKVPIAENYGVNFYIDSTARMYTNENFSNLNWGVMAIYLPEVDGEDQVAFGNMDPFSSSEPQDDFSTRAGYEMAQDIETAHDTASPGKDEGDPSKWPRKLLFDKILDTLESDDIFTRQGTERANNELKQQQSEEIKNDIINRKDWAPGP